MRTHTPSNTFDWSILAGDVRAWPIPVRFVPSEKKMNMNGSGAHVSFHNSTHTEATDATALKLGSEHSQSSGAFNPEV